MNEQKEKKLEHREKQILMISFFAGLLFAVVEFIYSIYSHSQSVLMDAFYDGTELIFIALIIFLTPLFHKPISEKHPYGFFQIESIFIIIKVIMMLSVSVSVSIEIIETALSGGNNVDKMNISVFQFILGIISVFIYFIMKRLNKPVSSPTVDAELLGWKTDIAYSMGMSVAFFGASFLERTSMYFIAPYFDCIVAVVIMLLMLPQSIKMLIGAIRDVFLFSPDEEMLEEVKNICGNVMQKTKYKPVFFDITKTGRHLWVSVYVRTTDKILNVHDFKNISNIISEKVKNTFDNCTCELILKP